MPAKPSHVATHSALMAVTAAVALSAAGCHVFVEQRLEPAARAGLAHCVAVDVSASYGLDTAGRRRANASDVFSAAKQRFVTLLVDEVLHDGDRIICIAPFTDEPVDSLRNMIEGGEIVIDSTNMASVHAQLNMLFDDLGLRDPSERYSTMYRNVLEFALQRLTEAGTGADQRIIIVLTDVRGSEVETAWEMQPEDYRHGYVLTLRAAPNGELEVTANSRLRSVVADQDTSVSGYVQAVRAHYRRAHPVVAVRPRTELLGTAAVLLVLLLLAAQFHFSRKRRLQQAPRIYAFFSPQGQAVVLMALNLDLPQEQDHYLVDAGSYTVVDVKRNGPGRVRLVLSEELPEGRHEVVVQTFGGPLRALFTVHARPKALQYQVIVSLVSDLASEHSVMLGGDEVELLQGFPRVRTTSLLAKREGPYLVIRARRGRVRSEDGTALLAPRSIALDHATSRRLVFDLVDEDDAVEITVRRIE